MDPNAQDARRLMSIHLPGLIDRYLHVPPAYRGQQDGEGKTVDERLVEALSAGRQATSPSCRIATARRINQGGVKQAKRDLKEAREASLVERDPQAKPDDGKD